MMTHSCPLGFTCWFKFLAGFLIWLLVASAFLWLTWNRVIGSLFKLKTAKYWQALLLIFSLCVLSFPRWYMAGLMHCMRSKDCPHERMGMSKDCPYSHANGQGTGEESGHTPGKE